MKYLQFILITITLLISISVFATPAEQADADKKPSWIERLFGTKETTKDVTEEASKSENKTLKFSEGDRKILEEWQKSHAGSQAPQKKLPPGLQKKVDRGGTLPPGWQKKLAVGAVLDPEIYKQSKPLPEDILIQLPDIPENIEIVHLGNKIIRIIENTQEIVDIFDSLSSEED